MDKRLSSRLSNLVLIAFIVTIVLLSAIKVLFPADDYRQQITQHLSQVAGQPVNVEGELEWFLSPLPSLYARTVLLDDIGISLEEVSISFSLSALAFFEVKPSSVQINKVLSRVNGKQVAPFEQVTINLDETGKTPHSFDLLIHPASLSSHSDTSKKPASNLILQFGGVINQTQPQHFEVAGSLSGVGESASSNLPIIKETDIKLSWSNRGSNSSQQFDLEMASGDFIASSTGLLSVSNDSIVITFEELNTPHLKLSGTSSWQTKEAIVESSFVSSSINIPGACFTEHNTLIAPACYDLALLAMLPGKNKLQADSLNTHNQSLENILINWDHSNGKILINSASAKIFGGQVNIQGNYELASSLWHLKLKGQHINVDSLLRTYTDKPQLRGTANINVTGSGELSHLPKESHKLKGEVVINDGETELFNLEKELCTQVKGVVVSSSTSTPFKTLKLTLDEENNHLKITHFISQLDGAEINGQGELTPEQALKLTMSVKIKKEEWPLCKLPRALTAIEWPLTCNQQPGAHGECSINIKQMGLSALLLAEDPERKEKAKQKIKELKESKKVKKVLSRFEQWLNE